MRTFLYTFSLKYIYYLIIYKNRNIYISHTLSCFMKRKAIQLAKQTIVISLPSKWIKQQGIKKGDDIDVEERGNELVIGGKLEKTHKKTREIDISALDPLANRIIQGFYVSGVDEIHIKFDKPKLIDKIQREIMNVLIGFEIVEQGKNTCIIKNISSELESEFDNLLSRTFFLVSSMAEEIIEALEKKDTNLEHIKFIDYNVNKFTNFCLRFLNKEGYKEYDKTSSIYSIIQGIEHGGDLYKKIANEITENKLKLNEKSIIVLKDTTLQFKDFQSLFYKFDDKKALDIATRYAEIKAKIKKMPKSNIAFSLNELNRIIVTELLSNQLTIR